MDAHLVVKIIHMSSVTLALIVFVLRALTLYVGTREQQPNPVAGKLLVALQHLSFTLIAITGLVLLDMKNFQVQPWFYAKVVLFLVVLSSLHKAFKKDPAILLLQRRAGLVLGAIALVAILTLVMTKPVFG